MSVPEHDLSREYLLTMVQAARRFPSFRANRPVNPSTVWRWCRQGVKVPGIGVIKLECRRLAGRWLTSEEAIGRFLLAQTPPEEAASVPAPRTPTQRQRAAERAGKELAKIGI